MISKRELSLKMREYHRYLGFFLAGIMAVYSVSGIVLIFRDSDFLKIKTEIIKNLDPDLKKTEMGNAIGNRRLKVDREENGMYYFKGGNYNTVTGEVVYTKAELPIILSKMTHFHKAKTGDPLFFFNIFFGVSLLFFVISAFYMFLPKTSIFRKGIYFAAAGIVLTILLLFV
ncbi:hypothetical protein DSM03_102537 [Leeuwenhoekiella aestuarii]|uniref:PepSY-associated transmembrane protein n=1 Tax=Leeuwenhoekiella aestuarii TaxID=2249426 RepID=A0A4Q0NVP4_9FLAO|nr:hypothetical protein [Leeuwenhoekiella aestuarii]RXG15229.1 hypothetical protein DSM04_103117 [Leeuwenhoekiella aestuarii]RXG17660.1 hypothetical protein DSM03_102537 [Leeuwenhoekiella aestuarii]